MVKFCFFGLGYKAHNLAFNKMYLRDECYENMVYELLLGVLIFDLDIFKLRIDAETKIAREGPRSCSPRYKSNIRLWNDGKAYDNWFIRWRISVRHTSRIPHFLVIEIGLKIRQGGCASSGIRHNLVASVDVVSLIKGLEYPPNTLHEVLVHGLIVWDCQSYLLAKQTVVKVNPTSKARDDLTPFSREFHDNWPALFVVVGDTKGLNVILCLKAMSFVNFKLNGKTVTVPSKPSGNTVSSLMSVSTIWVKVCNEETLSRCL